MNKLLKILLGLVGAVVLLVVVSVIVVPMLYDTEDIKRMISEEVEKQTGRKLVIAGDIDLSVFPYVAIEINDISLGNAPGFGDSPFASIGQAKAGVALIPLTRDELIVDEIVLSGLHLNLAVQSDGSSNWDDLAAGADGAAAPGQGQPSPFKDQSIAGLNVQDAKVEYQDDQAGAHYRLSNFDLTTGPLGGAGPVDFELAMLLEDLAAGSTLDLKMSGSAAADLENQVYTLDTLVLELDADGMPLTLASPSMVINLDAQTLNMNAFTAEAAGTTTTGSLKARDITGNVNFDGAMQVSQFSPAAVMESLGMEAIETADPNVLQSARLSASYEGSASRVALKGMEMVLDDSTVTGELRVRNFDAPIMRFDLNVDTIDLDRYMAPAAEDTSAEEAPVAIPSKELNDLNVQGTLRVAALRAMGLDLTDAEVGVKVADRRLRLNPLTAQFYGGTYSGNIVLDAAGEKPVISLNEKIEAVVFQQLAGDLLGQDTVSGDAFGHIKLSGTGNTSDEVLASLAGNIDLTLNEGALEGVNVWYEIRKGLAAFKGQPAPEPEEDRTVFSKMKLDASVQDGILSTKEMVGQLPFLNLNGNGSINLAQQVLDLDMVAAVRNVPELSQDPLGSDLKGKSLPFTVSGPITDPAIGVNYEELLKGEAVNVLMDKLGVSSEAGDFESTEDAAMGLLKGLMGGDDDDDEAAAAEEEKPKKKKRKKKKQDGEG